MKDFKIYLKPSEYQDEILLGRKVREYVEREFENFECLDYGDFDEAHVAGTSVVLPLSCPLVRFGDVSRAVKSLKLKGASKLAFEGSSAYICQKGGDGKTIFASLPSFFEINSAKSFSLVYNIQRDRIADRHLSNGVLLRDKSTTYIDDTVEIEAGAKILPFCRIEGRTRVMRGAEIFASYLSDCKVESEAKVECSYAVDSTIGKGATVGPFARLRGADIGANCRIGDFVEVKASKICDGAKSAHLTYIGDATVGERTNIGCGTVFCNYDGKNKHETAVGKDCFIGANVNLVAPLRVGDNSFVAAGTTLAEDIADDTFAIGRAITKTALNRHKTT